MSGTISVEAAMAVTGVSLGRFEVRSMSQLRKAVQALLPPRQSPVFVRETVILEDDAFLQHGETLNVVTEQVAVVRLIVKHRGEAWAITTSLEFSVGVCVIDVLGGYEEDMEGKCMRIPSFYAAQMLLESFRVGTKPEVVREAAGGKPLSIQEPLELTGDAELVLVIAEIPSLPTELVLARNDTDLLALGIDHLHETGDLVHAAYVRFDSWMRDCNVNL
jgi:hypothetical protein